STFGEGWSAFVEGAGVASAGDRYNSGANGRTRYPAITDPRGGELNQAWLRWQGTTFGATLGRQRLQLDNQRWLGNSGWRQFEQTYDAIALQWQPANDWTVHYDWLGRVHRVACPDATSPLARERKLDTSLFNVGYVHGAQSWVGYAYFHEDRDLRLALVRQLRRTRHRPGLVGGVCAAVRLRRQPGQLYSQLLAAGTRLDVSRDHRQAGLGISWQRRSVCLADTAGYLARIQWMGRPIQCHPARRAGRSLPGCIGPARSRPRCRQARLGRHVPRLPGRARRALRQ